MKHSAKRSLGLCVLVFFLFGCGENGSGEADDSSSFTEQEMPGVWLGNLVYKSDTTHPVFVVGIITEENEVRFIGDERQYTGAADALNITPNTPIVTGALTEYLYEDTATDYDSMQYTLNVNGFVTTRSFLWGTYRVAQNDDTGNFLLYYNTTYTEPPNVANLVGHWQIEDVLQEDNTVSLVISLMDAEDPTYGHIGGSDTLGNTFEGSIEIHYSEGIGQSFNVYDVNLSLNGEDLEGLATFVESVSTYGITEVPARTLAIGASNEQGRSFTGLATEVVPEP